MASAQHFQAIFTIAAVDRASRVIANFANNAARRFSALEKSVGEVSSKMRSMGTAAAATGAVVAASLAVPTQMAMDFQSAMTGLGKQAGVTRDALGLMTPAGSKVMAGLTKQVYALSREIPYTAIEIAGMMEAGARMGVVGEKNLAGFTKQTAMMAAAFDVADPARLAEDFGKLGNVLNIPINQMGGLADVINYLDDQTLAKGGDIIEVLTRVGGTARQLGMAKEQTAALATAFLSLGKAPETAATASAALLTKLATAPMRPDSFQTGLKELGLNDKALNLIMTSNPQKGLLNVLDKINALPKNRQVIVGARLFGAEFGDEAAALAQSVDKYRQIIALSQSSAARGSMQREFNARMQDTTNKLKIAGNMAAILAIKFGTLFLPLVNRAITVVTPLIDRLTKWVDANPVLARNIGLAAAAVAGFLIVGGTFLALLGSVGGAVASGFGMLAGFARTVGTVASKVMPAVNGLRNLYVAATILASVTPVGWIVGIGIALVAAAVLVSKYWKPLAGFFRGLFVGLIEGLRPLGAALAPGLKVVGALLAPVIGFAMAGVRWFGALLKPVDDVGGGAEKMGLRVGRALGGILPAIVNFATNGGAAMLKAGKTLVEMLAKGIMAKVDSVKTAIGNVTAAARQYLPFSPAKAGAFRDLNRVRIVETLAQGIKPAPLTQAMRAVTAAAMAVTISAVSGRPASASSLGVAAPVIAGAAASASSGLNPRDAGASSPVHITYAPTVTIQGGTADQADEFKAMLRAHGPELARIVENVKTTRQRGAF